MKKRILNYLKPNKNKKIIIILIVAMMPVFGFGAHELSITYFQEQTCVVCHEMRDPIEKWKASGTAKNHANCAGCHFDKGLKGWVDMNTSAARLLVEHFERDPNAPILPKEEPLFLEEGKEPGYWSHVPNSRCFKCHKESDQVKIHSKLIKNVASQPCKDCHNHEMRKGQKFYEKVAVQENQAG